MKYSKLNNIVKYYEKNEDVVLEKYESYVYDLINPRLDSECDTSKVVPQSYISYIIGRYSIDTYFKSYVKKGKGDYPTGDLINWVRSNYKQLEVEFVKVHTLNYAPIDLLKFILSKY
jgi:hypothetical protein